MQTSSPEILPDWTLGQLRAEFPGVELVLFANFGVGSRERSGFSASEQLRDLLRRHLIFDADKACRKLTELAQEDWKNGWEPDRVSLGLEKKEIVLIDARSAEEHHYCHLPTSRLLSQESVSWMKQNQQTPVVTFCNDGSQAPAASRVLRQMGLRAGHLLGGTKAWSENIDPGLPILYPLNQEPGQWYLLADAYTLRFRFPQKRGVQEPKFYSKTCLQEFEEGRKLLEDIPELDMLCLSPHFFSLRGSFDSLTDVIARLGEGRFEAECWEQRGEHSCVNEERRVLEETLSSESAKILASHKGTVEIQDYTDRVLTLALGGGCAGCASAQITTQRELAASLYRAVPLLDSIRSAEESNSAEAE